MTINEEGTFRRTGTEEKQDTAQAIENLKAELWTSWPNEAGVSSPLPYDFIQYLTLPVRPPRRTSRPH